MQKRPDSAMVRFIPDKRCRCHLCAKWPVICQLKLQPVFYRLFSDPSIFDPRAIFKLLIKLFAATPEPTKVFEKVFEVQDGPIDLSINAKKVQANPSPPDTPPKPVFKGISPNFIITYVI